MVKNLRLSSSVLEINFEAVEGIITDFIKIQTKQANASGVVIGLSGGVDSALCAKLCVSALGAENVSGLIMPSSISPPEDVDAAKIFAEELDINYEIINISPIEKAFSETCRHYGSSNRMANGNLKPRIRMCVLYYHANKMNRIVTGTGNKSELLIGYYTKYGDGGVDMLPIGDLYKTQVKRFSRYIKIPESIVERTPSARLWPGQTDEDEIGIKYDLLDLILYGLVDLKMQPSEVSKATDVSLDIVRKVSKMIKRSEHKRNMPPVLKIPKAV